jgi:hypothetical protein
MTSPYSKIRFYPKGKQEKHPGRCAAVASDRWSVVHEEVMKGNAQVTAWRHEEVKKGEALR